MGSIRDTGDHGFIKAEEPLPHTGAEKVLEELEKHFQTKIEQYESLGREILLSRPCYELAEIKAAQTKLFKLKSQHMGDK